MPNADSSATPPAPVSPRRRRRRRPALPWLLAAGLPPLLLAPDLVLSALAHAILAGLHLAWAVVHGLLGFLHLGFEHLLQEAFGLTRHAAQMATAWIGLALILAALAWAGQRAFTAARERADGLRREHAAGLLAWSAALSLFQPPAEPEKPEAASLSIEGDSSHGAQPGFETES